LDSVPLVTPERDGELLAETLALRDDVRELRAILAQVSIDLRGLPKTVAAVVRAASGERRGRLSEADRPTLSLLLPAISQAVGDCGFTVRWLLHHAEHADADLRHALERAAGQVDGGMAKRIGKLLHRAQDFILDDLHIERLDVVREGAVWRVSDISRAFNAPGNTQRRNAA
jgi:hypothetical protein